MRCVRGHPCTFERPVEELPPALPKNLLWTEMQKEITQYESRNHCKGTQNPVTALNLMKILLDTVQLQHLWAHGDHFSSGVALHKHKSSRALLELPETRATQTLQSCPAGYSRAGPGMEVKFQQMQAHSMRFPCTLTPSSPSSSRIIWIYLQDNHVLNTLSNSIPKMYDFFHWETHKPPNSQKHSEKKSQSRYNHYSDRSITS